MFLVFFTPVVFFYNFWFLKVFFYGSIYSLPNRIVPDHSKSAPDGNGDEAASSARST